VKGHTSQGSFFAWRERVLATRSWHTLLDNFNIKEEAVQLGICTTRYRSVPFSGHKNRGIFLILVVVQSVQIVQEISF
jgi:hypothetical protein